MLPLSVKKVCREFQQLNKLSKCILMKSQFFLYILTQHACDTISIQARWQTCLMISSSQARSASLSTRWWAGSADRLLTSIILNYALSYRSGRGANMHQSASHNIPFLTREKQVCPCSEDIKCPMFSSEQELSMTGLVPKDRTVSVKRVGKQKIYPQQMRVSFFQGISCQLATRTPPPDFASLSCSP